MLEIVAGQTGQRFDESASSVQVPKPYFRHPGASVVRKKRHHGVEVDFTISDLNPFAVKPASVREVDVTYMLPNRLDKLV